MDSCTYLPDHLGTALTQCLAELVCKRPWDPIEWMAHWLYRYADNELYYREKAIDIQEHLRERLALRRERERRLEDMDAMKDEITQVRTSVDENKKKKKTSALCDLAPRPPIDLRDLTAADMKNPEMMQRLRFLANARSADANRAFGKGGHHPTDTMAEYVDEYGNVVRGPLSADVLAKMRSGTNSRGPGTAPVSGFPSDEENTARRLRGKESTYVDENGILRYRYEMDDDDDNERWGGGGGGSATRSKMGFSDVALLGSTSVGLDLDVTWCLDCNLGLVCRHPVLGDIRARCPISHPETPQRWVSQGYRAENLYDHEIYSVSVHVPVRQSSSTRDSSPSTADNSNKIKRITSTRNVRPGISGAGWGGGSAADSTLEWRKPT